MPDTSTDQILADVAQKYGLDPTKAPAVQEAPAPEPPVEAAAEAQAGEAPPPSEAPQGEVAAPPPAPPAQPDIAALVAAEVAKITAAQAAAQKPAPAPEPSPIIKPVSVDDLIADPAGFMQRNGVSMEHVARSLVVANMRAQGQQPPAEWAAQNAMQPQIAQLTGLVQSLTGQIAGLKSEQRRDKYLAELDAAIDASKSPQIVKGRGKNRAKVVADARAEVTARAKFEDGVAPTTAEILRVVEERYAEYDAMFGSPAPAAPQVPNPSGDVATQAKTPPALPSTFRGSVPPVALTTEEAQRRIADEVVRKYSN